MQPLSYQSANETCWITSMVNGICLVKKENRVSTHVYRELNTLLRWNGVHYYTEQELDRFDEVVSKVSELSGLQIYRKRKECVEPAINDLHFDGQVAVCDIGDGDHSILLSDISNDDWFSGFDPWWYGTIRHDNDRLKFPRGDDVVNVKIHKDHLLEEELDTKGYEVGEAYQIGKVDSRFLTVIEKR